MPAVAPLLCDDGYADEESALEAQGLRAGDVLVSINDIVVAFMSYADMANTLSMAELPVVLSFARHVRPPNAEFARPENVFIKQVGRRHRIGHGTPALVDAVAADGECALRRRVGAPS